jgi:hypothetical protein
MVIPEIKISVTSSSPESSAFTDPDTGQLSPSGDGGWTLNPKSSFPLTIYGVNEAIAQDIKQTLENGYTQGPHWAIQNTIPLVARYNIRCDQVDRYVRKFKPIYRKKIEEQIQASSEWTSASDLDKEDLLFEFKCNSIASLDVRPYGDLSVLFEVENVDLTIDDALIKRYGFDVMRFYIVRRKGVYIIPADHYDRGMFERLSDVGLAIRGEKIPMQPTLEFLKLKELSSIVADLNPPKFSRKAKAIEYLMGVPDIAQRVSKVVGYRSLFQLLLLPVEFGHINLEKVSLSWRYAEALTGQICMTFYSSGYALQKKSHHLELMREYNSVRGWEIASTEDSCPFCKRASTKKHLKGQYPQVPLHLGCRCHALPVLKSSS